MIASGIVGGDGDADVAVQQAGEVDGSVSGDVVQDDRRAAAGGAEGEGRVGAGAEAGDGVGDGGLLGIADEAVADRHGEVAADIGGGVEDGGAGCPVRLNSSRLLRGDGEADVSVQQAGEVDGFRFRGGVQGGPRGPPRGGGGGG